MNLPKKSLWKEWSSKNNSIKKMIAGLFIAAWVIPVMMLVIGVFQYYSTSTTDQINTLMQTEMDMIAMNTAQMIDEAVERSLQPSYDRVWEDIYLDYKKNDISHGGYYNKINASLRSQFYLDKRFRMFAYYELDGELPLCYGSGEGHSVNEFVEQFQDEVDEIRNMDTSAVQIKVMDGRVFLLRNLYTINHYEKFGMLVLELNINATRQELYLKPKEDVLLLFGDTEEYILWPAQPDDTDRIEAAKRLMQFYSSEEKEIIHKMKDSTYIGYLLNRKYEKYHMGVGLLVSQKDIFEPLYMMRRLIIVILLGCIPVLFLVYRILNQQIGRPVARLVEACQVLERGGFEEVVGVKMPNSEFQYMMDSFTEMSRQLQYMFEYAYAEELARKDAKILALEAQINPHFLNNTLEIMKWKARMAGDMVVSEMIEKLRLLLNYRMDREGERLIRLKEELKCADAYLYIIGLRFGERVEVERVIDESLLDIKVPRLILQPLLENAVVHGVERVAKGKIIIHIYRKDALIYLQIINTGPRLSDEMVRRIREMLMGSPKAPEEGQSGHTSLGIRNVNERIKLIYGETYGLDIFCQEGGNTCASICIPETIPKKPELVERMVAKKRYQKATTEKYGSGE